MPYTTKYIIFNKKIAISGTNKKRQEFVEDCVDFLDKRTAFI